MKREILFKGKLRDMANFTINFFGSKDIENN